MSEGDLVMTFNKTLDIMRQAREMLAHTDPENPLREKFAQADRMMRRGVVEMAQSIGFAPAQPATGVPQGADVEATEPQENQVETVRPRRQERNGRK